MLEVSVIQWPFIVHIGTYCYCELYQLGEGRSAPILFYFCFPLQGVTLIGPSQFFWGKHLTLPKIEVQRGLPLAHLNMLQKFNFGQQLWHKLWCYWEYLEEHIGNLVNMMGMSLQTCGREHGGNNCFERHTLTPLVYKGKDPGLLRCMLSHFMGSMKILFTKLFVTSFGLGQYPFLKAWIPTYYFVWVCRYTSFFN